MEENKVFTYSNSLLNTRACVSVMQQEDVPVFRRQKCWFSCEMTTVVYVAPVRGTGGVCSRYFKHCSSKIVVRIVVRAQYCNVCACLSQK